MNEENGTSVGAADVTLSVIIPVYNGRDYLTASLPPLVAMQKRGEVAEVLGWNF